MQHGQLTRKKWLSEQLGSSPADHLSAAIEQGDQEEFWRLLKSEVSDLHKCLDSRGLGPLHVAVLAEKHKMARILLRHQTLLKLDVNVKSKDGWTALQFAAVRYGMNSKVARMLVKHGGDVHQLTVLNARPNGCQCKLNSFITRIHELSCPSPSTQLQPIFPRPHSLQMEEITSRLPEVNPQLVIDSLLQGGAIHRYHPAGSSDVRYCFPAYFSTKLLEDTWLDSHDHEVNAGRVLVPVCDPSQVNVVEVLLKLLLQVLSEIGEPRHVSETSFIFTSQSSKCLLVIHSTSNGIMVWVQSRHFTIKAFSHCRDVLEYIIKSTQHHANCFGCNIVSSYDVRRNLPNPHIYSATEVSSARKSGLACLQHPDGVEETFSDLLLEKAGANTQETPIKHQAKATCDDQSSRAQSVKRPLQYQTTTPSAAEHYWPAYTAAAAVRECYKDLVRFMKPELVIQTLVQAHCFTAEEASEMISHPNQTQQCMFLLGKLERKGDKGYHIFFQALKHEQDHFPHHGLWEKLIQACKYLTEERLLGLDDDGELCATLALGCSQESTSRSQRSDTEFRSLSSYSENSGSCAHTPLVNESESSLDSGIQTHTRQSRARRSLERKHKLKRPDTPGRVNAQAAVFTSNSHKQRRAISPLTVEIRRKTIAATSPASTSPPTTVDSYQGMSTVRGTLRGHFLSDYKHMHKYDVLGDFVMNDLDTEQQSHELLPPIPDIEEETESSCVEKDACHSSTCSSVNPPSAPIDVPLPSSASSASSSSGSPVCTSNLSSQSSTSSTGSWLLVSLNSPKDLSPEKTWKSNVLSFLRKFNLFSQDPTESSQSRERTSQDEYMPGLGYRM